MGRRDDILAELERRKTASAHVSRADDIRSEIARRDQPATAATSVEPTIEQPVESMVERLSSVGLEDPFSVINPPMQAVEFGLPEGVAESDIEANRQAALEKARPSKGIVSLGRISDSLGQALGDVTRKISGEHLKTPETEELHRFGQIDTSQGLLSDLQNLGATVLSSSTEERAAMIAENVPGTEFTKDELGNVFVTTPDGMRSVLNKPGFSESDGLKLMTQMYLYAKTAGGIAAKGVQNLFKRTLLQSTGAAGTAAGIEVGSEALGGEFEKGEVGLAAATAGAAEFIPGLASKAAKATRPFRKGGREKIAGEFLKKQASDPKEAMASLSKSGEFLTDPTTGVASRDVGMLSLERGMRNIDQTGRFAERISAQNLKRQKILDVIGGEEVAALKAARQEETGVLREAAFEASKLANVQPTLKRINDILSSPEGTRKAVRSALADFRGEIGRIINPKTGEVDPRKLYEIRKDINLAMFGKLSRGSDRSDFQLAKKELRQVVNSIDAVIEKSAPGFREYLERYARLSQKINEGEIIQGIQERAAANIVDPKTGREVLTQFKFRRMVRAEAKENNLTQEQLGVLQSIASDLDVGMSINAAGVRPSGSDTAKNLTTAYILGTKLGGSPAVETLKNIVRPLRWLEEVPESRLNALINDAMLDPSIALKLMQKATPKSVSELSAALIANAKASGQVIRQSSDPNNN